MTEPSEDILNESLGEVYRFMGGPFDGVCMRVLAPREFIFLPADPNEGHVFYLSFGRKHKRIRYKRAALGKTYTVDSAARVQL